MVTTQAAGGGVGIEVIGAKELRRTLKNAGEDVQDLKAAHATAGAIVTAASKPRVNSRSGRLASSIRPGVTARAAIIRAGGASVPYAGVIHWGWPARNIAAQGFITEAAQATEPLWTAAYAEAVDKVLATIHGK